MLPKIDFVDRPGSNHRAARFAALGAAVASLLGATTAQAAGAPHEPAFYTWQAPGGGSTAGHRVIALTFDDGPGPFTPKVLSVLEGYGVPATFFEIGENVTEYPRYTKMVASAGYPVEDHTWSHPDLATLPAAQVDAQIARTQQAIRSLTGETPACVRPPDDIWDSTVLGQIVGSSPGSGRRATFSSRSADLGRPLLPGRTPSTPSGTRPRPARRPLPTPRSQVPRGPRTATGSRRAAAAWSRTASPSTARWAGRRPARPVLRHRGEPGRRRVSRGRAAPRRSARTPDQPNRGRSTETGSPCTR